MAQNDSSGKTDQALSHRYGSLAKELLALRESSLAIKTCEQGIAKAPNSASLYIIKGQILLGKFTRKEKPEYLKTALVCFGKAIKLDPHNYLAKLLASQIYLKAGARKKAAALLRNILKQTPGDEKATSLLKGIKDKETAVAAAETRKEAGTQKIATVQPEEKATIKEAPATEEKVVDQNADTADYSRKEVEAVMNAKEPVEETKVAEESEPESEIVISSSLEDSSLDESRLDIPTSEISDPSTGGTSRDVSLPWKLDDKVVISAGESDNDEYVMETLTGKLTMFSRTEGLRGIFLLDSNGQPVKIINKAGLDENIIPSLVFNIFKASTNGIRRSGMGTFQLGVLVCPIGAIIIANAFYATLALVVDENSNLQLAESRVQRYLSEVTV